PDVVASRLLEGRVALIVDGSPIVLTMPYVFIEQFQSAEDYYANPFFSSFSRLIRILGFFIAISALPVYTSLITYHPEMLPSPLLFSIAASRDNVPLPTVLEAYALLIAFDILREAGKRTPDVIGQTMSIVGALILGQAAVEARFVSAPMIIVVAISGITGLMLPDMRSLITFSRLILMALSSFMGLYGYIFGILWLVSYIAGCTSFGIPILSKTSSEDSFIRVSWDKMKPYGRFAGGENVE
ncbi:MAG: spore germination protein, partial [Clostridia bacterium]|nr:spore germination protein [Clostridia bacterium]